MSWRNYTKFTGDMVGAVRTPRTSDPSCRTRLRTVLAARPPWDLCCRGYEAASPKAKAPCGMGRPGVTVQAEVPDSAPLSPGEHLRSGLSGVGLGLLQPPSQLSLGAAPPSQSPCRQSPGTEPRTQPSAGPLPREPSSPEDKRGVFLRNLSDKQRLQSLHQFPPL